MTNKEFLSRIWQNEDQMTADVYTWVNHNYPKFRKLFFHIPNGGARDKREGAKFKAMGLLPGAPDMLLISPLMAIELKMPGGRLSPDQKLVHEIWRAAGIDVMVAWNAQDVIEIFESLTNLIFSPHNNKEV